MIEEQITIIRAYTIGNNYAPKDITRETCNVNSSLKENGVRLSVNTDKGEGLHIHLTDALITRLAGIIAERELIKPYKGKTCFGCSYLNNGFCDKWDEEQSEDDKSCNEYL